MEGMAGVTSIEISAGVTVSAVFALTPPELADTVVLPVATLVARPPLLTVATPAAMDWFAGVTAREDKGGVVVVVPPPQPMMLRQSARPINVASMRRMATADCKIDRCVSKISSGCSNRNQDCGGRASFVIITAVVSGRERK